MRGIGMATILVIGFVVGKAAVAHECTESDWYSMVWWECDGDSTWIEFGYIDKPGTASDGMGICLYYYTIESGWRYRGDFITCYTETDPANDFYQIFAGSGDDVVKLAATTGDNPCGTNCQIHGTAESLLYFDFLGEAGADWLAVCDQLDPSTSDCLETDPEDSDTALWAAYGGDGTDYVFGSPYDDLLSGDAGTGDLIYGYGGDDELWDSGGSGGLAGGPGCDELHADTSAGGDNCWCDGNGGTQVGCNWNDGYCGGCS